MSNAIETGLSTPNRKGMAQAPEKLWREKTRFQVRTGEIGSQGFFRPRLVEQQSEELRDLYSRLLQAEDDERRRIARELHDSVGQTLALLSMELAQAIEHVPKTNTLFAKFAGQCQQLVDQLGRELRTTSYLLHPPLLDETGLAIATQSYVKGLTQRTGLEIALEIPADFPRLQREMELVMFRLVQECLTNIHRHSGSKSALIRFALQGKELSLLVRDAGKGIPAGVLSEIQAQSSGVGIRGMRERVRLFGGTMDMESSWRGTLIFFKLPLLRLAA